MLQKMAMAPTNIMLCRFLYPPAPIIMTKVIKVIATTRFTDALTDFPIVVVLKTWSD